MISYHERRKGGGAERAKRSPLKKNATALAVIQSIFLHQRRQALPPSRSTSHQRSPTLIKSAQYQYPYTYDQNKRRKALSLSILL